MTCISIVISGRPASFNQPMASVYSSPTGLLETSEVQNDPRQDFYSYSRQQQQQQQQQHQQQLVSQAQQQLVQQPQRHAESSRETPTTSDATGDALKGLSVLQKMLADLTVHNNQNADANNSLDDASGSAAATSSSFAVQETDYSKKSNLQLEAVLGQAAAAAMGLSRNHEALLKTPEAASLLSQLHSALQKLPYISRATSSAESVSATTLLNQQNNNVSPVLDHVSPKPDETTKQQEQPQHVHQPHLAFPHPFNMSASQRLFEDGEVITPNHVLDEHELGLFGGSKSVGATPINYSLTAAGGGMGSSPTTTMSSASFVHGVGCSIISHDLSPSSTTEVIATSKTRLANHSGASSTVPSSAEDVKEKQQQQIQIQQRLGNVANAFEDSKEEF